MKERFKTFLLISLVSISLLLTKSLWLKTPEQLINIFNNIKPKETYSYHLSDMISPNKYLLNFSEWNHTFMYDDSKYGIWQKSRENLIQVLSSKDIQVNEITDDEYKSKQNVKSLIFYFSEEINTYILTRAWGIKNPNNIMDIMPNIDKIYIYLGSNNPFFIFSNGEKHLSATANIFAGELIGVIDEIEAKEEHIYYHSMMEYGAKEDIYIPFEMDFSLPEIYVGNDVFLLDNRSKEELAERFLENDIDYIRQIVEGNGSSIYVYGQKVLKLNTNGVIEYFHALENKVKERNLYLSLTTASEFLSNKAQHTKGMYLANVKEIVQDGNEGYRLSFRYRVRGIPIILGNKEVGEYVNIEVFNDQIRSYKYYARKDMNKIPNKIPDENKMMPAIDIIDKNIKFFKDIYLSSMNLENEEDVENIVGKVLSSIEDITLAYYDPCLKEQEEKLIPVWAIKFKERLYAFDANNGILVYER